MAVKLIYWISTGLVCLVYLGSAAFYTFSMSAVQGTFIGFGYPGYLPYLLVPIKLLAVAALLVRRPVWLAQLAYAGCFYHLLLAFTAHVGAGDPGFVPAVVAFVLLITSWATQNAVRKGVAAYAPTRFGLA